jgi:hypothetical protein
MKTISIAIKDQVYRKAKVKAAAMDTSLKAAMRKFIEEFSGEPSDFEKRKRLQDETIASIQRFRAADRLPREEIHRHHATS